MNNVCFLSNLKMIPSNFRSFAKLRQVYHNLCLKNEQNDENDDLLIVKHDISFLIFVTHIDDQGYQYFFEFPIKSQNAS